ncbi:MAG: exonuclease SbcCD subunit D [Rubrobacter sp.]|nr:exonuclease SbcCD subunit D [Rubrobacter sp.]
MVRIAHISDTHLGYARYSRLDPLTNRNQREMDVAKAYERTVDEILARNVDMVIHSGDVFDTIRPATHVVIHFIKQSARITGERIPYFGIAGNHETPRLRATTASLEYANFAGAYFACGFEPESEFVEAGEAGVGLSLVPHGAVLDRELVVMPRSDADINILVTHGTVPGLTIKGHELGEVDLPGHVLSGGFDYIALGHYHFFHEHKKNAFYAGATERFGFGEVDSKPGFAILEFDGSGGEPGIEHVEIEARAMVDLPKIKATDMSPNDLTDAIRNASEKADIEDAITRLKVSDAPVGVAGGVDRAVLRDIKRRCLDFSLEISEAGSADSPDGDDNVDASFGSLEEEFKSFVAARKESGDLQKDFADDFLTRGVEYLRQAGEAGR